MIDIAARRSAAELLRHFAAGRLTNDEFERRWPSSSDPAVREIGRAAWMLYSDLREHRLTGPDRLSPRVRRQVARCVLFLLADRPYEWPVASPAQNLLRLVVNLLTLGAASRVSETRRLASGELDDWPFIRRADLRAALRRPRLLRRPVTP